VGIDISGETPKPIDPQLVGGVDIVVTLGREAHVEPIVGTEFENWDTDEPSERGIDGIERMRVCGTTSKKGFAASSTNSASARSPDARPVSLVAAVAGYVSESEIRSPAGIHRHRAQINSNANCSPPPSSTVPPSPATKG
jgi:hypothetical protein